MVIAMEISETSRRVRRLASIGAWCFVVIGVGHLLIMALSAVRGGTPAVQHARDAMRATPVSLLGLDRNMLQLYLGFSAATALLAIGTGVVNLAAVRLAPEVLVRGTALLWINLVLAVLVLAVSILAFPWPPIAALTVAVAAYGRALAVRRAEPAARSRPMSPAAP
jgi:hypothetical protein